MSLHPAKDSSSEMTCSLSIIYPGSKSSDGDSDPPKRPQPSYEAFSYTGGLSDLTSRISCHGRELPVTPSLESCLRTLRLGNEDRYLWIDQVCIDQGETDE